MACSGMTRPVASASVAPSANGTRAPATRSPRARAGRRAAPHAMRPTKSAVSGITYRAWDTARWYSSPATRVKEAPVQRRIPDAVASGIQVGISPKSRGERARPKAARPPATTAVTPTATAAVTRRPGRSSSQRGGRSATAAKAATPLDARRPSGEAEEHRGGPSPDDSTRRARAREASRRRTRGASGPASRLASVWIGERATRPPAQAAAHGPASCPATRAARAAASAPASSDGTRKAVSDVPAARVQRASPTAWSGGPEAPRPTSSEPGVPRERVGRHRPVDGDRRARREALALHERRLLGGSEAARAEAGEPHRRRQEEAPDECRRQGEPGSAGRGERAHGGRA